MEYNKGDKIKVQIANINDIGAFVKLREFNKQVQNYEMSL